MAGIQARAFGSGGFRDAGDKFKRAQMRAMNRTIATTRTFMSRSISKDLGLPVGKVRDQIVLRKARMDSLRARLTVSGARIPLVEFGARGREPSRGKGKGVTARIGGRVKRYPHAFIATMASGHRGVFTRDPIRRQRLPIIQLYGPSLPHVFDKYVQEGLRVADEEMKKNLRHEIQFTTQGA